MKTTPIIALALGLAAASPSFAVTYVEDGDLIDIPIGGDVYLGTITSKGGEGSAKILFDPQSNQTQLAFAQMSLSSFPDIPFKELKMSWIDAETGKVLDSVGTDVNEAPAFTSFIGGAPQFLVWTWLDSNEEAGFRFLVGVAPAEVPLPSAYLLLGTALCGTAAMRRKKKAA